MENKEAGGQIEDNDFYRLKARGYFEQLGKPITQCQHCYCSESMVNGKPHLVCCICGHRTLKNPITY